MYGLDFVAPYWFQYNEGLFVNNSGNSDTDNASSVYYRESNNSFLLTRATREIRRAFHNATEFIATHLFIVTWIIVNSENDLSKMVSKYKF